MSVFEFVTLTLTTWSVPPSKSCHVKLRGKQSFAVVLNGKKQALVISSSEATSGRPFLPSSTHGEVECQLDICLPLLLMQVFSWLGLNVLIHTFTETPISRLYVCGVEVPC